jgi:hypothetical protein
MRSRTVALLTAFAACSGGCGGSGTPTTASSTAGTVYRQATVRLEQTFTLDLDTGTLPPGLGTGADIWFQAVTEQVRYLSPMPSSGAALAVSGATAPGFSGCSAATLTATNIVIETLTAGLYLCARTSENRISEIRVVEPAGPSGPTAAITISYTTYTR